jgi:carbon starvation protein
MAGIFYGKLVSRWLGEDNTRATPAKSSADGRDYVATPTAVVFAHHFASIAGAGPIIGTILGLAWGWGPAILWLIIGGVFIGAVHDYSAMFLSLRSGGRSIAVVARKALGKAAYVMFVVMIIALLALVTAAFLKLSANALTSMYPADKMGVDPTEKGLFEIDTGADGQPQVIIGGIASTSVIVITLFSPLMGYLYLKRKLSIWLCSLLALIICCISVTIGLFKPVRLSPDVWMYCIAVYTLLAAGLPVWLLLQSRDFINVHILYVGFLVLVASVMTAAFMGKQISPPDAMPAFNLDYGEQVRGPLWPVMFITIACGAVSGFHSLCGTGTAPKQLTCESAARHVGFFSMLLETVLAVLVVGACMIGLSFTDYGQIVYPGNGNNPILAFAVAIGNTVNLGLGLPKAIGAVFAMLMLEGFVITTLDTAIRLNRYLIEEIWAILFANTDVFAGSVKAGDLEEEGSHKPVRKTSGLSRGFLMFLKKYWVNSGLAVLLMLILAKGNTVAAIWNIFGSSNQLLAALTLTVVSVWLLRSGKKPLFTVVPAIFMLVTTLTMLIRLLALNYIPDWQNNKALLVADVVVLIFSAGFLLIAVRSIIAHFRRPSAAGKEAK